MRRIGFALGVFALAGCGGAAHLPSAPLVRGDMLAASGYPVLQSGPGGIVLRFIERGHLELGLALRNRTARPVTIVGVRTPEPPGSLVAQERVRFVAFNPKPCPRGWSCPALMFPLGSGSRAPYTLAPHKQAGVTLGYRLGTCGELAFASYAPGTQLVVDYRYGGGSVHEQSFALGSARLHVRRPPAAACDHRPHSQIAVSGPYATSTQWTVPSSGSATCRKTAEGARVCTGDDTCHAGVFRSGTYQFPGKPMVYVTIALAQKRVTAWVGIGLHGWTPFRSTYAVVTTTRRSAHALGGRFHATVAAHRRGSFRVYGAWRCTVA